MDSGSIIWGYQYSGCLIDRYNRVYTFKENTLAILRIYILNVCLNLMFVNFPIKYCELDIRVNCLLFSNITQLSYCRFTPLKTHQQQNQHKNVSAV